MARPEPFKGGSADARRFLQFYNLWGRSKGKPLNDENNAADPEQWIMHALAFFQGEAAMWASPYLQAIERHHTEASRSAGQANAVITPFPFNSSRSDFTDAFKARFMVADDRLVAQREIENFAQGNRPVTEYAARFQDIAARTEYSPQDLMARFKRGLKQENRQWVGLASLSNPVTTLDALVQLAIKCDFHMKDSPGAGRTSTSAQYTPSTSACDPYAMEIDATCGPSGHTREDFVKQMKGRCFGCGTRGHIKANSNHGSMCQATKCRVAHCKWGVESID
jgi:hypothetical protein